MPRLSAALLIGLSVVAAGAAETLGADKPAGKAAKARPAAPTLPPAGPLLSDKADGVARLALLPPSPTNPRNSEGDLVQLRDGRLLLVYTHFTGGGGDHATAHLASRTSGDGGRTWTATDVVVVANEGQRNVMSVSLVRLADGRLALFYLRKNSDLDCRPVMRVSTDEAQSWSPPSECIADAVGYYVMNNDRAVQLASGRLLLPLCLHATPQQPKLDWHGTLLCYLSDDGGRSWRASQDRRRGRTPDGQPVVLQEPGVVELKDGRLWMFARTRSGVQYGCYSSDGGERWTEPQPTKLASPCSPATIERIPATGDLLAVWNNHAGVGPELKDKRTPLTVAVSGDEGRTWRHVYNLEDDPNGWYCYTAMEFVGRDVVLAHCAGSTKIVPHLAFTQLTRFSLDWLYGRP